MFFAATRKSELTYGCNPFHSIHSRFENLAVVRVCRQTFFSVEVFHCEGQIAHNFIRDCVIYCGDMSSLMRECAYCIKRKL